MCQILQANKNILIMQNIQKHWRIVKTPYTDDACADIDITFI